MATCQIYLFCSPTSLCGATPAPRPLQFIKLQNWTLTWTLICLGNVPQVNWLISVNWFPFCAPCQDFQLHIGYTGRKENTYFVSIINKEVFFFLEFFFWAKHQLWRQLLSLQIHLFTLVKPEKINLLPWPKTIECIPSVVYLGTRLLLQNGCFSVGVGPKVFFSRSLNITAP